MTLVLMQKTGEADISVDSTNVAAHERLGWTRAKITISDDGQSLVVPYGTYIDFVDGSLKLNGVQITPSAAEINVLNTNEDVVVPVRYEIAPDAVSAVAVHAAANLASGAQDITSGITPPDVPRTLTVKGNVSGITGDVVLTGTNFSDVAIEDTIALNGTGEVEGVLAFKTLTNIHLPARAHVPAYQVETATVAAAGTKQVETATVVGTIVDPGDTSVIVTAAGMNGSPKTIAVAVLALDDANAVAGKIRTALGLDADVTALFDVSGADANVILTSKTFAANDGTLNLSIDNGTCTGLTTAASSANTTAGVAVNTIGGSGNATVIVTATGMTGSPKTISVAVLAGDTVDQVAEKIRTALGLDADVTALFDVSGATDKVILPAKNYAANIANLNISIDNGTCAGLTTAASSANTTGGVPVDTVSVGMAKKFGLPHIVDNASLLQEKIFDGSDDGGSLAVDADEIEKNLYTLDGTPDGAKVLTLIYLN